MMSWMSNESGIIHIYIYIYLFFNDIYVSQLMLQIVVKLRLITLILRTQFMVSVWNWGQELPFSTSGRRSGSQQEWHLRHFCVEDFIFGDLMMLLLLMEEIPLTSWGWQFIPLFTGFYVFQVVQDFWTINRFVASPGRHHDLKVSPVVSETKKDDGWNQFELMPIVEPLVVNML